MVATRYLDRDIPALKLTDKVSFAWEMMLDHSIRQLPVIENKQFKGIFDIDLIDLESAKDLEIGNFALQHEQTIIPENYHFYEIARIASEKFLQIIPVKSVEGEYLGILNVKRAALDFANKFADHPNGGVVVLSISMVDYSLSELSRLVESNEAKILSSFIETDEFNPNQLLVTLKVNTIDLTRILATFERFGYNVVAKFHDQETDDFNEHRLDLLLKYLEI